VDNLKIIQLGITLSDKNGNLPKDVSTWQFNFKFDVDNDNCTPEAINLLESAGIDFNKFLQKGICPQQFAEHFISSGIVLNDNVNWITFHGIYDLAYLLKLLSNKKIPENEAMFMEELDVYFHNHFDIRYMIRELSWLRGSLTKLAAYLDIQRIGSAHQAGSDSLVTSKLYFKIVEQFNDHIDIERDRNSVFGIYDEYENMQRSQMIDQESFSNKMNSNKFNEGYGYQNKVMMSQMGINMNNFKQNVNFNGLKYQNSLSINQQNMNNYFIPQQNNYSFNPSINSYYPNNHQYDIMNRFLNNGVSSNIHSEELNFFSGNIVSN
jgi:CCR4-NOT transcription complex subunit 7/8